MPLYRYDSIQVLYEHFLKAKFVTGDSHVLLSWRFHRSVFVQNDFCANQNIFYFDLYHNKYLQFSFCENLPPRNQHVLSRLSSYYFSSLVTLVDNKISIESFKKGSTVCVGHIGGEGIWPLTWPRGAENSLAFTCIKSKRECPGHHRGGGVGGGRESGAFSSLDLFHNGVSSFRVLLYVTLIVK